MSAHNADRRADLMGQLTKADTQKASNLTYLTPDLKATVTCLEHVGASLLMDQLELRSRLEKIRDLSDVDLAEAIIDCLKPALVQNATAIKSSAIVTGDFTTQFNLQVLLNLFDGDSMSIKTTGFVEPSQFKATKTGKKWTK